MKEHVPKLVLYITQGIYIRVHVFLEEYLWWRCGRFRNDSSDHDWVVLYTPSPPHNPNNHFTEKKIDDEPIGESTFQKYRETLLLLNVSISVEDADGTSSNGPHLGIYPPQYLHWKTEMKLTMNQFNSTPHTFFIHGNRSIDCQSPHEINHFTWLLLSLAG